MKENSLTFASIGAAIVASLCCIGTLVAAILGLGAFSAAGFEKFRPYFLGLTGVFLVGAFYLAYRPDKTQACTESTCQPKSPTRSARLFLWIAPALVMLFAGFPYYSPALWSKFAQTSSEVVPVPPALQPAPAEISTLTLNIEGMTCGGCAAAIKSSLSELKGVAAVAVSFEKETATVRYHSSQVTAKQMIHAVKKTGYKASVQE